VTDDRLTLRKIEIFSAGCAACNDVLEICKGAACPSCEVTVHDMKDISVAKHSCRLDCTDVQTLSEQGPDCATYSWKAVPTAEVIRELQSWTAHNPSG
jgi:hypothetical protein